jgi:hypothetical protein
MSKLFDAPTINIAPGELKAEDIKAYAEKMGGEWIASAFVDRGESRIILAMSHGKYRKPVLRDVLEKAVHRVDRGDYSVH